MASHGVPLTKEQESARALAQHSEEAEHQQQQLHEEQEKKGVASSLLSRALHFSRAPPPSEPSTDGSTSRLLSVLFLSSTNSIVPHIAAAMTNANHGDHLKARWSTSSPDSPLVDEHASEAMQEHEVPHLHPAAQGCRAETAVCGC